MLEYLKEILKMCIPEQQSDIAHRMPTCSLPRSHDNLFYFCRRLALRFFVSGTRSGCATAGWMAVAEGPVPACAFTNRNAFPVFWYSAGASTIPWANFDSGYTKIR